MKLTWKKPPISCLPFQCLIRDQKLQKFFVSESLDTDDQMAVLFVQYLVIYNNLRNSIKVLPKEVGSKFCRILKMPKIIKFCIVAKLCQIWSE